MASSQQGFIAGKSTLGTLLHDNYVNGIKPHYRLMDPIATLFDEVGPGQYTLVGKKVVFSADLRLPGGAMSSSGYLPAHQEVQPVNLEFSASRMYRRVAVDNFLEQIASGDGAYEDYAGRLQSQAWDSLAWMTSRHIHGSSAATVAEVDARTSATSITIKNGMGYAGQPPTQFLEVGMWVTALDASNAFAVLGAAIITNINHTTNTLTFGTGIDNGTVLVAAGDPLVFSTTYNVNADYFETERGKAPLGLLDIIDPKAQNASYLTVSESAFPRIKPLRRASVSFGEVELMEFLSELRTRGMTQVSTDTHVLSAQEGVVMELAKSLVPYTTIETKGRELEGGWTTVRIAGHDIITSAFHVFDTLYAHDPSVYRQVDLDGEARIYQEDGSMYNRLDDYDGKEWFIRHYMQRFAERRNTLGALVGIANTNAVRYSGVPA